MVSRALMVLTAFAVLCSCGQANSAAEHRATAVASGRTLERCPDDGACAAKPNANPVPNVIGLPVFAACRELRPHGYTGAVVGELADGVSGPSRVVDRKSVV